MYSVGTRTEQSLQLKTKESRAGSFQLWTRWFPKQGILLLKSSSKSFCPFRMRFSCQNNRVWKHALCDKEKSPRDTKKCPLSPGNSLPTWYSSLSLLMVLLKLFFSDYAISNSPSQLLGCGFKFLNAI